MFNNDVTDCNRNSNVLLHTEETVIHRNIDDVRNYRNIQSDLNRLLKWYMKLV